MGKNEIDALLDFYLFSDLEDEEAMDLYLVEEGLDFDSFYESMGMLIKNEKGRIFKIDRGQKIPGRMSQQC